MGMRKPKVLVQGASQADLEQRQQQFEQQMSLQKQQGEAQLGLLQQQLEQQAAIAGEQKKSLLEQLQASGNAASANYLANILSQLTQQTGVAVEAKNNRKAGEQQATQLAVQENRANSSQATAQAELGNILSQLTRKSKRYVK
jgi:type I site-specific restriction-modification system R (restriction) subunit